MQLTNIVKVITNPTVVGTDDIIEVKEEKKKGKKGNPFRDESPEAWLKRAEAAGLVPDTQHPAKGLVVVSSTVSTVTYAELLNSSGKSLAKWYIVKGTRVEYTDDAATPFAKAMLRKLRITKGDSRTAINNYAEKMENGRNALLQLTRRALNKDITTEYSDAIVKAIIAGYLPPAEARERARQLAREAYAARVKFRIEAKIEANKKQQQAAAERRARREKEKKEKVTEAVAVVSKTAVGTGTIGIAALMKGRIK